MKGSLTFVTIIMMFLQSLSTSNKDASVSTKGIWIWCPFPNPLYDYNEVRSM